MTIITDKTNEGVDMFCSIPNAMCRVSISNKCPNVAFLSTLVVDSKRRKKGLATVLIGEVVDKAREMGCSVVSLEVNYKSWRAAWYRKLGFTPTYYGYQGDLITMSMML